MIDINKKYQTRNGRDVRIYCTDGGGSYPVHGAIKLNDGTWYAYQWRPNGRYCPGVESDFDLIEAPPRIKKGFVNIYADGQGWVYPSRRDSIACIEITFRTGTDWKVNNND